VSTALLVGVLWGTWHLPLFRDADSFSGALPLVLLLVQLFAWLPAYRVLLVRIYDRTGSVLMAALMHASLIATQLVLRPAQLSDAQSLASILVWAGLLWAVVLIASKAPSSPNPGLMFGARPAARFKACPKGWRSWRFERSDRTSGSRSSVAGS
jgi:hypothetical protein